MTSPTHVGLDLVARLASTGGGLCVDATLGKDVRGGKCGLVGRRGRDGNREGTKGNEGLEEGGSVP